VSTTTERKTTDEVVEAIRQDLSGIEEKVMTPSLADLIRAGSQHTEKEEGWGSGDTACALSAAALGATALGVIKA
jgi:hypothetical protein